MATSDGELFDNRAVAEEQLFWNAHRDGFLVGRGSNRRRKAVALLKHHARVANIRRRTTSGGAARSSRYDVVHVSCEHRGLAKAGAYRSIFSTLGGVPFGTGSTQSGRLADVEKDPAVRRRCVALAVPSRKTPAVRVHRCGGCGFVENRDVNAAINIPSGPVRARRPEAPHAGDL